MKITAVKIWKENLKLTRPYTIAYETVDSVENVFVRLEAANGMTGIGAGSPAPDVTGETMAACMAALDGLEETFVGADLRYCRTLLSSLSQQLVLTPAAMAAADIALHDLVGKSLGLPLADLFGRAHDRLPTSITIGILPLEETLEEVRECLDRGFSVLKIKTGLDVEADIERVLKTHELAGPGVLIRVDANQGYTAEAYQHFFDRTSHCVEFTEQPLKADHIKEMQTLSERLRKTACADESLHTPADLPTLLQKPGPFGIFNIKLMKCGGIAPGLEIAGMAHHANIDLMWGCMDESIVSISAALHAALASPATRYLDLDGSLDLAADIVTAGFILENGTLRTTDRPGLGVKQIR